MCMAVDLFVFILSYIHCASDIIHILIAILENSQPLYLYILPLYYSPSFLLLELLDLYWTFSFYPQYFKISLLYFPFETSCLATVVNSMLFTFNFSAIVIWEWQVKTSCFIQCYSVMVNFLKKIPCMLWGKANCLNIALHKNPSSARRKQLPYFLKNSKQPYSNGMRQHLELQCLL